WSFGEGTSKRPESTSLLLHLSRGIRSRDAFSSGEPENVPLRMRKSSFGADRRYEGYDFLIFEASTMKPAAAGFLLSVLVAAGGFRPLQQTADSNDALDAFARSLVLRADRVIVDPTHTAMLWLPQNAPVTYTSQGPLRLTLALRVPGADSQIVKLLTTVRVFGG